jgi:transposase
LAESLSESGKITFVLEPVRRPKEVRASPEGYVRHGVRWRMIRSLSIGPHPVFLKVMVQRWRNVQTGAEFEHSPPFARAHSRLARNVERYIVALSRLMTLSDIAGLLQLSWDTVKEVIKKRLSIDFAQIELKHVKHIAIDELYLGKRKKYITLVICLESGRILWVGEGRGGSALRGFWKRLKRSGTKIRAVAMDMSGAYAAAVRERLPHALITFDRFHVIKLMNKRLDELRSSLVREAQGKDAKAQIKGLRWLLLHKKSNLQADAQRRLEEALALNEPLATAYLLKEQMGEIWEQADGRQGWGMMQSWCATARATGIKQLVAMAKTLLRHAKGILSYYQTRITSGKMEGTNRKIRGLLSAAYGMRDYEFIKLRLYALHQAKWTFVG